MIVMMMMIIIIVFVVWLQILCKITLHNVNAVKRFFLWGVLKPLVLLCSIVQLLLRILKQNKILINRILVTRILRYLTVCMCVCVCVCVCVCGKVYFNYSRIFIVFLEIIH